jgi:ADP-ribose pyrophosphatase YjhB (NUDIX family)
MPTQRKAGPSVECVPEGDTRVRLVCPDCGYIAYDNPKIVVGAVCMLNHRVLLCRRAIQPRLGCWTIPAGFLELGESMAEGAARETREEACARVEIGDLIGLYEVPRIGQLHVFYHARLMAPEFAPGVESQDVALFDWKDIPWDELAFPSVVWALKQAQAAKGLAVLVAPVDSWPYGMADD